MIESGNMEFEEIGHGKVLTKLVHKIQEEAPKSLKDDVQNREVEAEKSSQEQEIENDQQDSIPLTAEEKVRDWNQNHPIGTRVKSMIMEDDDLETRTEAVVLFGHRAAVYMKGYNGYYDLDEIRAL